MKVAIIFVGISEKIQVVLKDSIRIQYKVRFFCLVLVALLFACTGKPSESSGFKVIPLESNKPYWKIKDTVEFEITAVIPVITDQNDDKIIFVDAINSRVFICEKSGKKSSEFDQTGIQKKGFGRMVSGAIFKTDSTILINSNLGFYEYDFSGRLVSSFKHSERIAQHSGAGLYFTGQMKIAPQKDETTGNIKSLVTPLDLSTDLPVFHPSWVQEVKNLRFINFSDTSYHAFLPYPDKSIYRESNGYFHFHYPLISVDENRLAVIFNLEPRIYFYSLDSEPELTSAIKLDIELSKPISHPFGKGEGNFNESLMSDRYDKIFFDNGIIYLSLIKWTPINASITSAELSKSKTKFENFTNYVQVYNLKEDSYSTIECPREFPYLQDVHGGVFYFSQEKGLLDHEPDHEQILLTKLVLN